MTVIVSFNIVVISFRENVKCHIVSGPAAKWKKVTYQLISESQILVIFIVYLSLQFIKRPHLHRDIYMNTICHTIWYN